MSDDWKLIELRGGEERRLNATEYETRVQQLAGMLRAEGLVAGDRVCQMMDNCVEAVELRSACTRLAIFCVPVNYHFTADEARYIIDNSGARALFVTRDFANVATEAIRGLDALDNRRFCARGMHPAFRAYEDAVATSAAHAEQASTVAGTVLYTSGTTGRPKGVVREARPMKESLAGLEMFRNRFGLGPSPVHLVTGPLYHASPAAWASVTMFLGGKLVIQAKFDAEEVLQATEKYRVTNMHLVPTMMHRLLALPDTVKRRYDLSSLNSIQHGAAPCPPATKKAMLDWWGPIIGEYYGSTEAGIVTYITAHEARERPTSVGRPVQEVQIKIFDDDGNELPVGGVGTIYVKTIASDSFEYHGDPDKLAAAKRAGFFTNGDVGRLDEDGYLYLMDRKADMIISGGVNIYPAEIEAVLHEHPEVADCAVFGVPDDEWGESVHAVVQLEPGSNLGDAELLAYARERLARYKVPRRIEFMAELPRQPNGKIYKRKLRDPHWAGRETAIR
jgi:long-chain acyl-CoA synthetase